MRRRGLVDVDTLFFPTSGTFPPAELESMSLFYVMKSSSPPELVSVRGSCVLRKTTFRFSCISGVTSLAALGGTLRTACAKAASFGERVKGEIT